MDFSNPKKRRRVVTDADRARIREHNRLHPSPQRHLVAWFKYETGHELNQSQVSKILSSDYDYLDTGKHKNVTKHRSPDYPDLEIALFEWQQRQQKKKNIVTGDLLKGQALRLWQRLPQYQNVTEPKWSNGWLDRFKKRYSIKQYHNHGEAGSADVDNPAMIEQMNDVRALCATYANKDIFNMDETGLFWKLIPSRTLATEAQSGAKKKKDRVTIALTVNADGTEKLDPWVIGRSQNPRCFKNINVQLLRVQYEFNQSKWMTGVIMEKYLRWFDAQMHGRKVLLLLDNFSGHDVGVQLVGGLEGLTNTRVAWLPPNTTSHWQPLDQGIIANFKLHYRKQWVAYMLRISEEGKDPLKTVTLLKAIQWSRAAWSRDVQPSTIQKCFWKSTIIPKPDGESTTLNQQNEYDDLQSQIASIPSITDPLPVPEFLEPPGEEIIDNDEDIERSVIEKYSIDVDDDPELLEEEQDDVVEEPVPLAEALQCFERLKLYELQQEDGEVSILQALDKLGNKITQKRIGSRKQVTLHSFFDVRKS